MAKIKVIGDQKSRYALIGTQYDYETHQKPTGEITFLYDNDLDFLKEVKLHTTEHCLEQNKIYLDLVIYDYKEMRYVR